MSPLPSQGTSYFEVRAKLDQLEEDLKQAQGIAAGAGEEAGAQMAQSFNDKLGDLGDTLTNTLTPAAAAIAGFSAYAAKEFNEGARTIRKETGLTGDALNELVIIMRSVGRSGVTTGMSEIGAVIAKLKQRTDVTGPALQSLTKQIVLLAELSDTDASDSVEGLIDLFKVWQVATTDQARLLDVLYRAHQASGQSVEELAAALVTGAGPLKNFNFTLEESIGFIAQLEREGGNAPKTLSAMQVAFVKLSQSMDDPAAGFELLADRIERAKNTAAALAIGVEAFGSKAAPVLVSAIRKGRFEVEEFSAALANGKETIADARNDTLSLADRFNRLKTSAAGMIGPIAQTVATIATIATGVGPAVNGVKNLRTNLEQAARTAGGSKGAAASFGATALSGAGLGVAAGTAAIALIGVSFALQQAAARAQAMEAATEAGSQALLSGAVSLDQYENQMVDYIDKGHVSLAVLKGQAAAIDRATEAVNNQVASLSDAGVELTKHQRGAVDAALAEGNFSRALGTVSEAQEEATRLGKLNTQTHKNQAKAARDAASAELALAGGFFAIHDAQRQAKDTQEAYAAAQAKVSRLAERGKEDTKRYVDAVREEKDARDAAIHAQQQAEAAVRSYDAALRDNEETTQEARKAAVDSFRASAREAGLSKREIDKLVRSVYTYKNGLLSVPDEVNTRVNLNIRAATAALRTVKTALESLVIPDFDVPSGGGSAPRPSGDTSQGSTDNSGDALFSHTGSRVVVPPVNVILDGHRIQRQFDRRRILMEGE